MWLLLAAVALGIGAAAQVTREEFDALAKQVKALEGKVVLLDVQVMRLDRAGRPERLAQQAPAALGQLQGRDLQAWKLARDAVRKNRWGGGLPTRRLHFGPETQPLAQRSQTGDYLFYFPESADGRVDLVYKVQVTDYGSELRVEKVTSTNDSSLIAWTAAALMQP